SDNCQPPHGARFRAEESRPDTSTGPGSTAINAPRAAYLVRRRAPQALPPWRRAGIGAQPGATEHVRKVPSGQIGERGGVGGAAAVQASGAPVHGWRVT